VETRAQEVARLDDQIWTTIAIGNRRRRFSEGTRPVIRWIKGDGRDDNVTSTAIAVATRLFGSQVDYVLTTTPEININATRVRKILEFAVEPVEWWPVTSKDNPELARVLNEANCTEQLFGYWWKWFPERVRHAAPELVLDGDMVLTGKPDWWDLFVSGRDVLRVSQDDLAVGPIYAKYFNASSTLRVNMTQMLYSGAVSLPPNFTYNHFFLETLREIPLDSPHNGTIDMDEQGVVAIAFQQLQPETIKLYQFPFGRAFEKKLDFGAKGDQGKAWGYHFGRAFARYNEHFDKMVTEGQLFRAENQTDNVAATNWLGGNGQWGVPGWSMESRMARLIVDRAKAFRGKRVLELGTSRGRLTATLARAGLPGITTVDQHDRGAAVNLALLDVKVVVGDGADFVARTEAGSWDLIVVDFHGNGPREWRRIGPLLEKALSPKGTMLLNNAVLYKIPEWTDETGIKVWLDGLKTGWKWEVIEDPLPGLAIVSRA
jgi:hypothetical protein